MASMFTDENNLITPKVAPKELFELKTLAQDDVQILSGNDLNLALYGSAQSTNQLADSEDEFTIISLWRPNDVIAQGQYECWETLQVGKIIKKKLANDASNSNQCLFTGKNGKVFFFTCDEHGVVELSIIDSVAENESAETVTKRYLIDAEGKLWSALQKQLRLFPSETIFSFSDPTLVNIKNSLYLVATELDQDGIPCLSFWKIINDKIDTEATFTISGAEMLLDCDETGKVTYLTNAALLQAVPLPNGLQYARLSSPSQVVQISYQLLKRLKRKNAKQAFQEIQSGGQRWALSTDPNSMLFFRTQSHTFAFVEAIFARTDKIVVLRFFCGDTEKVPVALYFNIVEKQPVLPSGVLNGHFINKDDSLVRLNLKLSFKDASGLGLSDSSSGIAANGQQYSVRQQINSDVWVPTQCSYGKSLPFRVHELTFFADTGAISGGKIDHGFGRNAQMCDLRPMPATLAINELDESLGIAFSFERSFKFGLIESSQVAGPTSPRPVAILEGCYRHEPFNAHIIGQYRRVSSSTGQEHIINFVLQRKTQSRINFRARDSGVSSEFNVEIMGGDVFDMSERLNFRQSFQSSLLVEYAHRAIFVEDEGVFILNGNLCKVHSSKTRRRGGNKGLDKALKITKFMNGSETDNLVERQDTALQSEEHLKAKLFEKTTTVSGLIQTLAVSNNPFQVMFTYLRPDSQDFNNNSLKFITDETNPEIVQEDANCEENKKKSYVASGLTRRQYKVDYPLLAYNSFLPDNSEIVVTNMAERAKVSQVVQLGRWRFIAFIDSPCQSKVLQIQEQHSQIFFLAWHSEKKQLRVMMLEQDPWSTEKTFNLFLVKSDEIKGLPQPLDELRMTSLLTASEDMYLVLQFDDDLWSIPLRNPERAGRILDPEVRRMKKRFTVRRLEDTGHLYCLVQKGTRDEVLKIGINLDDATEKLNVVSIFESPNSKLLTLVADPESKKHLFILTDDELVIKIEDPGNGKANTIFSFDMSVHELEDEVELIEKMPWSSVVVSDRVLVIDDYNFSLRSSFFWQTKTPEDRKLVQEVNLLGTLSSIQFWMLKDGSSIASLRPIAGTNHIDLTGQYKPSAKMLAYVASDDKILVQTEQMQTLVFDSYGYICHEDLPDLLWERQLKILKQSPITKEYGCFFLLKSISGGFQQPVENKRQLRYSLLQSDNAGFSVILEDFPIYKLKSWIIKEIGLNALSERLNIGNKNSEDQAKRDRLTNLFQSTLKMHMNQIQVSSTGELIVPASVIIEQADVKSTIFHSSDESNNVEKYATHKHLFGLYQYRQIKIVLFVCNHIVQQHAFGDGASSFATRNKRKGSRLTNGKYKISQMNEPVHNESNLDTNLVFGMVGPKLTWIALGSKRVQHIDFDELSRVTESQGTDTLRWAIVDSPSFSVKELLTSQAQDDLLKEGINIDMIPESSLLQIKKGRKQKKEQESQYSSYFMQLTIGEKVMVYDLGMKERHEVAMINAVNEFDSPITFSHTGFVLKTNERQFDTNMSATLGVQRPCQLNLGKSVFRAFSEIDLQQLKKINELVLQKSELSTSDAGIIECETLINVYWKETFFTLFQEQASLYDVIINKTKKGFKSSVDPQADKSANELFIRTLANVLDRPTPLQILRSDEDGWIQPQDMSILKQSLLFQERKATVSIFKLAQLLDIYLSDVVECIEDLVIFIERLPAQQYSIIVSKFEKNMHTTAIREAVMARRGNKSELITFIQQSAVIWEHTPALGLHREQQDDEIKQRVNVQVLPLKAIHSYDSQTNLFTFIRDNLNRLQDTLLLDSIFEAFWEEQRKLIFRYGFLPFLLFFFAANFYYSQCLFSSDMDASRSVWYVICVNFVEEDSCNIQDKLEPSFWYAFLVLTCYQMFVEVYQSNQEGFRAYIKMRANQIDLATHILNLTALVMIKTGVELYKVRIIASLAIICLWSQLFFWFRLFDSLAQYVDLIFQTMADIRNFMTVLVALVVMFMSGFYMIQLNRMEIGSNHAEQVFDENDSNSGTIYGSGLISQYFLLLGHFNKDGLWRSNDGYASSGWIQLENSLAMFYFFASTFITQIVIFNMLIAIMSATFGRHTEDLDQNAKRQKLTLQSEYIKLVNFYTRIFCCSKKDSKKSQSGYLYVVTPRSSADEDDGDDSDGTNEGGNDLKSIKNKLNDRFKELDGILNKRVMPGLMSLQEDTNARLDSIERNSLELQRIIKKDTQSKFAKMKEDQEKDTGELKKLTQETETALKKDIQQVQKILLGSFNKLEQANMEHIRTTYLGKKA